MKNTLLFISLLSLLSACELTVGERQIFVKNVNLSTQYNLITAIPTSKGFYIQVQKDFRSSDSSSLGLLSKTQYIVAQVDFDGNINWQRIDDKMMLINLSEDDKGNFYDIDQIMPNKLRRFDSFLQKNAETTLFFDKFTDKNIYAGAFEYWKDDKFLLYGGVIVKGGSEYVYQQFFSIVSIKNGIEKFVLDSEQMPESSYKYQINEAGEIYGFITQLDVKNKQTKLLSRKYDINFKQIEAKNKSLPYLINAGNLTLNKKGLYLINQDYVNNVSSLISIDQNLEVRELPLGFSYSSQNFVKTSDNSLMILDDKKLYAITDDFKLSIIDNLEKPVYNPFIKIDNKATTYLIANGNRLNEIIFSQKIANEPTSNKLLYFE